MNKELTKEQIKNLFESGLSDEIISQINNRLKETKSLKTKEKNVGKSKDPIFENTVSKDTIAVTIAQILNEEEQYVSEVVEGVEVLLKYDKGIFNKIKPLHFRNYLAGRFKAAKTSQIRDKVYTELKDLVAREGLCWGKKLTQWEIPLGAFIWDCSKDCRIEHTRENYLRSVISVDSYDPEDIIDTPNWDRVVHNICITEGGEFDPTKGDLLHEIMGLLLTQRALLKVLLIFQGPKDSSKTLISKVLSDLIGAEHTVAFKIHRADDNFGLEILPGKLFAIDSEPKKGKNLQIDGAILKQLTGGEEDLYINAKNKSHESKSITTKFLLLANTLPYIEDDSGVIFDRLLILNFEQTVTNPDIELHEKLKSEYRGIVHKAIKGYSNVAKRFQRGDTEIFTLPKSTQQALQIYKAQNMPILKYCVKRIRKTSDPNDYISFQELYTDYCCFIQLNSELGLKELTPKAFARALNKTQYKTVERKPKKKGKNIRSSFSTTPLKNITALWGYKFINEKE
jgi:phage/plasmid-associated DNA primase